MTEGIIKQDMIRVMKNQLDSITKKDFVDFSLGFVKHPNSDKFVREIEINIVKDVPIPEHDFDCEDCDGCDDC